jgi:hypothetical protein
VSWIKYRVQEYERTAYTWEQYDPMTGQGKRRSTLFILTSLFHLTVL